MGGEKGIPKWKGVVRHNDNNNKTIILLKVYLL